VGRLRQGPVFRAMGGVLRRYLGQGDFRIVHVSIQRNHLHLLVEASDREVLSRRMQSFAINAARAINRTSRRSGQVFPYRYHATQIRTPRQARCTLAYVLNNWRHHLEDWNMGRQFEAAVDPYSSGVSFTGWKGRRFVVPRGYTPLLVSPPETDLLRSGWMRFGRIDAFEMPGPPRL
jgi:REP element-mobilizing transposase RayT